MNSMDIDGSTTAPGRLKGWNNAINVKQLVALFDRPAVFNIALTVVLLVAAIFRFNDLNWDESRHLHPDERFLSTLTNDLKWPENLDNYFDPQTSSLSPYSLPSMGLFVYGTLPVYVVKWTAILLDQNNYDKITLLGRTLSGLFDIATIIFLFLIAKRLYNKKVGLLAAGLLSISVLNIQLSHFYTVDTFANLFVVSTVYFVLRANQSGRWTDHAVTGLLFGLGLASKLNVITLVVPVILGAGAGFIQHRREGNLQANVEQTLVRLLTVFFIAALTFRIVQPIAFSGPGFWNLSLNERWVKDITDQQKILNGDSDLPWIQQWTNRSMLFPVANLVLWGMGLPLGLASLAGLGLAIFELVRGRKMEHLLPVVFVGVTFLYQAGMFIKFMRYFLPVYPFLILLTAYGVQRIWKLANQPLEDSSEGELPENTPTRLERFQRRITPGPGAVLALVLVLLGGTLFYALAFSSIYGRMNSRIAASRWMYQNLPQGSTLANEHWDDWLPIGGLDGKTSYGDQGMFKSVEMANYEDDNPKKLDWMVERLSQADYIILSSNRLYASIPRLPVRYPMTSRYYQLLFSGKLGFERIKEFTSYPTFLGIQIPDQSAEESFSVYDHPRVQIFKKSAAFDPVVLRQELGDGIVWESVIHLTPRQASATSKSLLLNAGEQSLYQQAAKWSSSEVNPYSWGSRMPLLAWFLIFMVFGLIALPLTLVVFKAFIDRGYIFSKAIGLLVAAWGAWLIASLRLAPFTWWSILAVMAFMAFGSAILISRQKMDELRDFIRNRWRLLLLEEVLFWLFFGFLLFIRWHNPDLWHPGLGGEKPMDVAYLNANAHTPYFPSYDPWFSGGYINYYYFGFVLAAAFVHLTGIMPEVAYNLAVPSFFALTAMGAFTVTLNFTGRWRNKNLDTGEFLPGVDNSSLLAGLAGAFFVAIIGNLGQVQLLWDGVRNLSGIPQPDRASIQVNLAQFLGGLSKLLTGEHLSFRTEWWYWNATRIIPAAKGEAGPINEMPFFTFLFGDLHAHMMALPYTLLALGLALNLILSGSKNNAELEAKPWWRDPVEILTLALMGFTTGALWPMNTWDYPTYSILMVAALCCREYARRGRLDQDFIWSVAWRAGLILVAGRLLFLPFHQNYAGTYFGAELWKGSRTPLWAYLLIHGFFLFILSSFMLAEFFKGHGNNSLLRSCRLQLRYLTRRGRLQRLFDHLVQPTAGYRLFVDAGKLAILLVVVVFVANPVIGLPLALTLLAGMLLFKRRPDPLGQFMLSMTGLGLVFTAMVEYIVLKGDISRMNTVFKFYLQVWVLWGITSAAALPRLAAWLKIYPRHERISIPEPQEGSSWTPEFAREVEQLQRRPSGSWSRRWWWAFGIMLAACALYPLTATPVRMGDRFKNSQSATLDGSAYMQTAIYMDENRPVTLGWDRQAFSWLQANIHGIPTILEANTPLYRWGSRVSIYTGLPTVIGWDWHQKQQRSILPGQVIDHRIEDVKTIYNSLDLEQTKKLLELYQVQYIYVGQLERLYYDQNGLGKFDQAKDLWSLVYQNEQVKIYRVNKTN
ncbi:MAG TPA: DUF2298 domain-containing protein [Anaerolineales bacterium]|jgi:YYY domain-containing protein